jgi:hypothetical protein
MESQWVEKQIGKVQSFEKVEHTFLNEDSGEMYCEVCKQSEKTKPNRSRSFLIRLNQTKAFEKFTEHHLHEKVIQ